MNSKSNIFGPGPHDHTLRVLLVTSQSVKGRRRGGIEPGCRAILLKLGSRGRRIQIRGGTRPGMSPVEARDVLKAIYGGACDVVLASSLDRLSRDARVLRALVAAAAERGVRVIAPDDGFDTADPASTAHFG